MTTGRPADALTAAGVPRERWGRKRLRSLTDAERAFYRWILKSFGAGAPARPDELADAATALDLEVEPALRRLAREDLVHHDPATGAILVAYPFSGRSTAHQVRFDGREVYAMCAIDALGIAPMLDEAVEIASFDPLTDDRIEVVLDPDGNGTWQPPEAVVVCGVSGSGNSCSSCCPVLNFFASTENAERWLAQHPGVRGEVISMQEAILAGRAVFGEVLKED